MCREAWISNLSNGWQIMEAFSERKKIYIRAILTSKKGFAWTHGFAGLLGFHPRMEKYGNKCLHRLCPF